MNIQPLFDYIARYVILTAEEQQLLLANVNRRRYLKGQYIVQQGDICQFENFVLSGCVKSFYIDPEGHEHIAMFAIENWWVTDLGSFIKQRPADYNVLCLENTELVQFHHEKLEALYQKIPSLERFFRIIIQNAFVASQDRIVQSMSVPARERYLAFRQKYPQIERRVPQYMVASYLGITKEFLSKIRSQLIHEQ
ncbi:MAG: Crp/Fnr family transcriptional regulator [Imperialibacter sp.]|uniref:Crp/Fnr family transcriptional regulator n=1 Tax=Imperialibacter sp. TaxID=2038411 RepID=UPI0032EB2B7C